MIIIAYILLSLLSAISLAFLKKEGKVKYSRQVYVLACFLSPACIGFIFWALYVWIKHKRSEITFNQRTGVITINKSYEEATIYCTTEDAVIKGIKATVNGKPVKVKKIT